MKTGLCRLCLQKAELIDSHIIPRWAWVRAREPRLRNPNVARLGDGVAKQDQTQVHEHMLCRQCENLMKWGEDYAHRVTYQRDRSAPFLDLVGQVVEEANGLRLALPGRLEVERLAHFGVSVIWRASVAACVPSCKLGADHEEALRQYLLRQSAFPDDVTCFVKFHDLPFGSEAVTSIYTLPTITGEEASAFLIFGLAFKLEVGEHGRTLRPLCALHSPQHWVGLGPQEDIADWLGDWVPKQV